jgi:hypothetical protein
MAKKDRGGRPLPVTKEFVDFLFAQKGELSWPQFEDRFGVGKSVLHEWKAKVDKGEPVLTESAVLARICRHLFERLGKRPKNLHLPEETCRTVEELGLKEPSAKEEAGQQSGGTKERGQPQGPDQPIVPRLSQLPSVVIDFVGREQETGRIMAHLCVAGGKVGLSAVRGMGGVGKTSLAVKVAHQVKDRFPDAQLFLDLQGMAEKPVTAAEAMARVIRDFHPERSKLPETEEELLPLYRGVLAGKRALILLDNAASELQVRNLITVPPPVAFLLTSRIALALDGVESVPLGGLSPEEAFALLRGIVWPGRGTDDELHDVIRLCDHLPLAIRVAGDFLRLKTDWTFGEYINALKKEALRYLKVGNDPQKNVEAVLKLSSAQLAREDIDLATRWHCMWDWPSDFDLAAAAAAWGMASDDPDVRKNLSELAGRSLILFDERSRRYRLHDLMKPIAEGLFG